MEKNLKTGYCSIDRPYTKILSDKKFNPDYCRKTAFDMVLQSPSINMSAPAFDYYGKIIKTKEFIENINIVRNAATNLGVKKDEIVFMFCLNTPEMIYSLYGLNQLGAVTEWFNPTAISAEMLREHIIENNIKTMVIIDIMYPLVKKAIQGTNVEKIIVTSLKDSFDLKHKMLYEAQIRGINHILQSNYVKKNIAFIKNNILSLRDEGNNTYQKQELKRLQKIINKLYEYSEKEKIAAKANFYTDRNVDSRFICWNDLINNYYSKIEDNKNPYDDERTSFIVHTGGTTGVVKRVAMTDYNVNSAIYQSTLTPVNMDFGDSFCQIIPPIVAWSLEGIHTARYYNMKTYLICTYDRNEFVDIMLKTKANHYFIVPSFVKTLNDNKKINNKDLSFVKTINHGGEAFSKEDDKETDITLANHNSSAKNQFGFGQNEEFGCFTINIDLPDFPKDFSCCGVPFPGNDYTILDLENKKELKYGKNENGTYNIGELYVSGPTLMKGYIGKDEDKNKTHFVIINGKKYFDTGDQTYIDDNGKLWYYTRNERIIRTQDGKIFTNVIENIITQTSHIDFSYAP